MHIFTYGQLTPLPSENPVISCLVKVQTGFVFLVPAHPGCPEEEAVTWVFCFVFVRLLNHEHDRVMS